MQFQFSFKHMSTSAALQKYAEDKLRAQIEKFVSKPIEAHVVFLVDNHRHIAQCALTGGDGFSIQVEHECDDMYGSIDHVVDKLTARLKKKKDKLKEHKPMRGKVSDFNYRAEKDIVDIDNVEVDAADIIKFEQARRRQTGS